MPGAGDRRAVARDVPTGGPAAGRRAGCERAPGGRRRALARLRAGVAAAAAGAARPRVGAPAREVLRLPPGGQAGAAPARGASTPAPRATRMRPRPRMPATSSWARPTSAGSSRRDERVEARLPSGRGVRRRATACSRPASRCWRWCRAAPTRCACGACSAISAIRSRRCTSSTGCAAGRAWPTPRSAPAWAPRSCRVDLPAGPNLEARAREARYAAARERAHGRPIATGHTLTDQAETVVYRLASSSGPRACGRCGRAAASSPGRCCAPRRRDARVVPAARAPPVHRRDQRRPRASAAT